MKQLYFFISCLVLLPVATFAKTSNGQNASVSVTDIFPHFSSQGQASKLISSRLVGKMHAINNGISFIPVDSITYSYNSNDRGGATTAEQPNNDESILFDNSYSYSFNGTGYDKKMHRSQLFNSVNQVINLTYSNWRDDLANWRDSARYIYAYNNFTMTSSNFQLWYGGLWSDHIHSDLHYDNNANVTELSSTDYVALFTYDANNNLTVMIDSTWSATVGWSLDTRKTYTYAGNNVATYTLEQWDRVSNKWAPSSYYEYTYDGSGNTQTMIVSDWNGSGWVKSARNTYTYDANHNKISDETETWDATSNSFQLSSRQLFSYNYYNQPEKITSYTWDATNSKWYFSANDEELRFYYEVYFPTSIGNLELTQGTMQLYPNPAVSDVNVDIAFTQQQPFNVSVTDMTGRVVLLYDEKGALEYHRVIPVSMLTSGNYMIQVVSGDLRLNQKFVVQH